MGASKTLTPSTGNDRDAGASDQRVLDLDHLGIYTLGNRDLERELLGLFHAQMREQLLAILGARSAGDWNYATHTLKGAARALGAWAVAETAANLEHLDFAADAAQKAALVARLEADIVNCQRAIGNILDRA